MKMSEGARRGKIIRGIGGFYTVHDGRGRTCECRARGLFRNQNIRPLVGDDVEFILLPGEEDSGSILRILPRRNELARPAAANVDQVMVVFAVKQPDPSFPLLDRFLVAALCQGLAPVLLFNKADLAQEEERTAIREIYRAAGYPLLFVSAVSGEGLEEMSRAMEGKTTALAGPSGVGKSSLLNLLIPDARMETGELSQKIGRGRHTTRRSELFCVKEDTFLMDTPGFTSLDLPEEDASDLQTCYPEFAPYAENCRFPDCVHVGERDCGVKAALAQGKISPVRYDNYLRLYQEIRDTKRYR